MKDEEGSINKQSYNIKEEKKSKQIQTNTKHGFVDSDDAFFFFFSSLNF